MGRSSCWPGRCLAVALLVGLAGGTAPADAPEKKTLKQQQAENERLRAENEALGNLIRKADKELFRLTLENARLRVERVEAATERDVARKRVESLLERVRELEKTKAGAATAKGPDGPNPPPAQVKGVIEKIKEGPKGGALVQISIGSDAGLAVGHTLEVYRLEPRPQYLGMIRIVTVEAHRAVGQRVPPLRGAPQKEVRSGDHVASRIP